MRHSRKERQMGRLKRLVLGAVVFAVGWLAADWTGISSAEPSLQTVAAASTGGTITAIHEMRLDINHKTYSLIPEVLLLDRHGDPLEMSDLKVDLEVKYHLLKGTTDQIDQMIVFLPE